MDNTKSCINQVGRYVVIRDIPLAYIAEEWLDGVTKVEHDTVSGITKLRYKDQTKAIGYSCWLRELEKINLLED